METKILTIFTRTPLHVGAGSSVGAVDQPIIRERHTRFPVIPGSSIKGVLADLFLDYREAVLDENGKEKKDANGNTNYRRIGEARMLFGSDDQKDAMAGSLLVGEAKLLAFPVRSAKGCFAWITCPLALSRFKRDVPAAASIEVPKSVVGVSIAPECKLLLNNVSVVFEEYPLVKENAPIGESIVSALTAVCSDAVWKNGLKEHLAIVSDEIFMHFVENACEIAQHNVINDTTGVVDNFFNSENVPSETLFYAVINNNDRREGKINMLDDKLKSSDVDGVLQIGGDASTGLGWCSVKLI